MVPKYLGGRACQTARAVNWLGSKLAGASTGVSRVRWRRGGEGGDARCTCREERSRPGGTASVAGAVDGDASARRSSWQVVLRLLFVADDFDVAIAGQEARLVASHHEVVDDLAERQALRGLAGVMLAQEGKCALDGL
eukprot:scaffold76989_cov102-Phaeocystis_antarctica.AAC.2